ncbi:MAG: tRNA pseudouridine(38-40) synthase TruA [Betaproteobacteria bacterium]|nr:tRNA pseudouridine(38-40) synthase TruA [Betaproteobacteria bacterium]
MSATRIALRLAYEGAAFQGWQTQPGGLAAQDVLERALAQVAGHPVATVCAGRTDAGVHALAQVVHFDTAAVRPPGAWIRGVNAHLPAGIAVQHALEAPADFHARFHAQRRQYRYLIRRAPTRHPLWAGRAAWVHRPLAVAAMRDAAAALVGEHDFSAFRSSQCQARSPVRRLEAIDLIEQGELLIIDLRANAFLHHMVRNLVGSLVWVGMGRRPPAWLASVLASRDRTLAAPTMAAQGLYLSGVEYPSLPGLGAWPPLLPF